AETGEQAQDVALHAEVERHYVIFRGFLFAIAICERPWRFLPCEALSDRNVLGEIEVFEAAPRCSAGLERVEVELAARIMRDDCVLRSAFADERGQRTGIDTGEGDDAAMLEPCVQIFRSAEIRWRGDVGLED